MDHDTLFEEATKMKQHNFDLKDELNKVKAKLKILESENMKKDKQMIDFDSNNRHS